MKIKIIALVSNNIATDQRLIKVGTTLNNYGFDFNLIGTTQRGVPNLDHIPFKTKRVSVLFQKEFLFYAELQCRLFVALLRTSKKNAIILANDLDTLLPAYLISKMYRLPLIFDSHEIFSELPSLKENSIQKKVWQFLEKWLVPQVDAMYTVSQGYAKFFRKQYQVDAEVVSNFPISSHNSLEKAVNGVKVKRKTQLSVLIYQGAINYSRGIDKMILAMQYLEDAELWLVGDGPMKKEYQQLVQEKGLNNKIKFLGLINPIELKKITPQADLGLSLEEDNGLSYRYALPNKVFDYIHAGIPVLGSSDLPEVANIINHYKIGGVIENHEPKHIAKKIQVLLSQDKDVFREGLSKAKDDLNWQSQEEKLVKIFK